MSIKLLFLFTVLGAFGLVYMFLRWVGGRDGQDSQPYQRPTDVSDENPPDAE